MDCPLRVIVTDVTCPYFNLATEDWIYNDMPLQQKVLFLWRNEPCIIVGRGQNVWSECRLDQVESDGVHVVRRHSGGGAVYQDLGNTCFTFMSAREPQLSTRDLYARNNSILLQTLAGLGLRAVATGRNDITVEHDGAEYKVSGSAFKESKDRCFHHGTMLLNVDLGRLSGYLTPDSKKLQAKGIKSVGSRVTNLRSLHPALDHHLFSEALIEQFFHHYGARAEVEHLTTSHLEENESLRHYYEKLKSWDWVYGKTPSFAATWRERLSFGSCELHLDASQGLIQGASLFTDSLDPEPVMAAAEFLKGRPFSKAGVEEARSAHLARSDLAEQATLDSLYNWIKTEI